MPEFARLLSAAFTSELRASRRLASRTGCSPEAALRATLAASAGADANVDAGTVDRSLAGLLAARDALRLADAERAAAVARTGAGAGVGQPPAWRGWFDGSAHPNPGECGIGALLKGPGGEHVEISRAAGYGNSSEAEYRALVALLEAALDCGADDLIIYGDSKVVIDDINGKFADAVVSLLDCRAQALALMARLPEVSVRWIARHKNGEADALSQRAGRGDGAALLPMR